ncbi:sugar ABC transporter substrate-binding protein [Bacillus sp. FJAT-49705]|uniref:Sugar ABC transporter substrate-binding protein n=1 Tax=Cytobacillus citreus TaxID=2833586 RepID=A0ABS5NX86_9BACI|nr:sugar ABC transporter substrate-binding protein [Cytobacillus citreus]MBS4192452.1 sugar ABC transporter substrate-binding protein [Cytobacillus citreus]
MKKLLVIFLSMLLIVSATACSKESSGDSKDKKNGKDVITIWTYPHYRENAEINQKSYEQHLQELIAEVEKENKDIKVEYEILSWEEGDKKFDIALNSGNPPDIFFSTMKPKYIKTGLAVPLDDYIDAEDRKDLEQFAIDNFSIDGKLWAISQWISIHTWGGNKALLEAAGADVAKIQKDGWTWQEFYEISEKISKMTTKDGKKIYGFATQGKNEETFTHLMRNNGVPKSVTEDGEFKWDGEEAVETLSFVKKMMDNGVMPKETAGLDEQKVIDMFTAGETGIFGRTGPYQVRFNDNRNKEIDAGKIEGEKIDFALLPFPHNEGVKEVATGGGGGMWLFKQKKYKGDKHTENAAKVLKHITGTKSSITAATLFIPPARKSGQEMYKDLLQLNTDNGQFIKRTLDYVVPGAKLDPELAQKQDQILNDGIRPKFQGFLAGELSPEETVEQWTQVAESVLK